MDGWAAQGVDRGIEALHGGVFSTCPERAIGTNTHVSRLRWDSNDWNGAWNRSNKSGWTFKHLPPKPQALECVETLETLETNCCTADKISTNACEYPQRIRDAEEQIPAVRFRRCRALQTGLRWINASSPSQPSRLRTFHD